MAYTKHTWQCGESISADLLNHMEQGIEDANGGGSGDCGYECVIAYTEILNESVTTTIYGEDAYGKMSESIVNIPRIRVTFNGTEYICDADEYGGYGASYDEDAGVADFSEYPFQIARDTLYTQNAGTYTVKVESLELSVETTECFEKAVVKVIEEQPDSVAIPQYSYLTFDRQETYGGITYNVYTSTISRDEMSDLVDNNYTVILVDPYGNMVNFNPSNSDPQTIHVDVAYSSMDVINWGYNLTGSDYMWWEMRSAYSLT